MKVFRWTVALAAALVLTSCDEDVTQPPPVVNPPSGLTIEIPERIVRGQAFTLTVTARDDAGAQDDSWNGSVTLTASNGTLSPATVEVTSGRATAQVTLDGYVGNVTIRASSGNVQSEPVSSVVLSGEAPARLEVLPGSALLPGAGAAQEFEVIAFDAQGAPTVAPTVTWATNNAAAVSIDSTGLATSQAASGSAMIVASAGDVQSAPVLVLVAQPAPDAVLLPDSLIASAPAAVDGAAAYEPGWRYRVRVRGVAPAVGEIVIGTGAVPLAGRVVGATAAAGGETDLIVELVALNELFSDLSISERIPMVEAGDPGAGAGARAMQDARLHGMADTEFNLGRFKCTASGSVPSLDVSNPTLDITADLFLEIGYNNGLDRLAVTGTLSADANYKPVFEAKFEGKATCETVLKTFTIPAYGILALFYGVQVPLGVGFELDGKLEIAEVGFDISADAKANVELGLTCPGGGACSGLTKFDLSRDGSFEFIAPDPSEQFRVQLGGYGFVFARPYLGSLFTSALSFEFVDATAGLRQDIDLGTTHMQVEDTAYASSFNLRFLADIGPGKDLQSALERIGKLLGTDLSGSLQLLEVDDTLATSPRGTFVISPESVEPGDSTQLGEMATFTVTLDPITYLGLSSVDKVEFFWKHTSEDSSTFTLDPGRPSCTEVAGSSGKTEFECKTDFLEEHEGEQNFYAFVHAKLFGVPLPIPIEIAADAQAMVEVGGCAREWVTVGTQAQVDSLAGVCEMLGLLISETPGTDDPIVDLTPLDSLRLVHNRFGIQNTTQLTSLAGLERLTVVQPEIFITGNQVLTSLAGLGTEATATTQRLGSVYIYDNAVLSDISAFANLIAPAGVQVHDLSISNNPPLTSLAGLEAIEAVSDNGSIGNSPALSSVAALAGLREVTGRLSISNTAIPALDLSALAFVEGQVLVERNPSLLSVKLAIDSVVVPDWSNGIFIQDNGALQTADVTVGGGHPDIRFKNEPALTRLSLRVEDGNGGLLSVERTGLTTIDLFAVQEAEYLYIDDNPSLTNIDAVRGVTRVHNVLSIQRNESLCLPDWVYNITSWNYRFLAGNKSDCAATSQAPLPAWLEEGTP